MNYIVEILQDASFTYFIRNGGLCYDIVDLNNVINDLLLHYYEYLIQYYNFENDV